MGARYDQPAVIRSASSVASGRLGWMLCSRYGPAGIVDVGIEQARRVQVQAQFRLL